MLILNRESGAWQDSWFDQLPELLREGDVLVLNDSRVIPARLFGVRLGRKRREGGSAAYRAGQRLGMEGTDAPGTQDDGGPAAGLRDAGWGRASPRHGRSERRVRRTSSSLHAGGRFLRPAGASGACPAASLHSPSGPGAGSGALPDRLCASTRLGRRAHRRAALHPGNSWSGSAPEACSSPT